MIFKTLRLITLGLFTAVSQGIAGKPEALLHEGGQYLVHQVPAADLASLHLVWRGDDGQPLANFGGLRDWLRQQGERIEFATNAGIYEHGPKPCGLTVCRGVEQVLLNLADGEGNFYLKPNGVFFIDQTGRAGVLEAAAFGRAGIPVRLATQSGPTLLLNGQIHPGFNPTSQHRRQRSGVGVRAADGTVIFVLSVREAGAAGQVTFHQLARTFLHLGCRDALYLDGDISQFCVQPTDGEKFSPQTFAAMFYQVVPR